MDIQVQLLDQGYALLPVLDCVCLLGTGALPYAGHGLRDLLPVRTMTRTRRCGPLLKIERKNAATIEISTENRKQVQDELALTVHGGLMQVQPPFQAQATACSI